MSGIDEQLKDIPECPFCGNKPDYWTISYKRPVLWLFSEDYRNAIGPDGLGEPYKNYKGEGKHDVLIDIERFASAKCMGRNACGSMITSIEEPEIFDWFFRLFLKYFPKQIYNTGG